MPTIERARHVQAHMTAFDGKDRAIYYDRRFQCFRVLEPNSLSFYVFGRENFIKVENP